MKKETEQGLTVHCAFETGLCMPQTCVCCNNPIDDKKYNVVAFTRLHTSKAIFKFPICDECNNANEQYINIKPIIGIGTLAFVFSLFTLLHQPEYILLSNTLFMIGGIGWLIILTAWILWSIRKAAHQNQSEIVSRRSELRSCVKPIELVPPKRHHSGQITFRFINASFAKEFVKKNKGKIIR